jgi:DNA replication protein DnaC
VRKSHLCVGLGVKAVQLGFSVQYFRFDELMTALRADAGMPPARLKRRRTGTDRSAVPAPPPPRTARSVAVAVDP